MKYFSARLYFFWQVIFLTEIPSHLPDFNLILLLFFFSLILLLPKSNQKWKHIEHKKVVPFVFFSSNVFFCHTFWQKFKLVIFCVQYLILFSFRPTTNIEGCSHPEVAVTRWVLSRYLYLQGMFLFTLYAPFKLLSLAIKLI